jgi:hypothetical protein
MNTIKSKAEADGAVDDLSGVLAGLSELVQRETAFVRAGQLRKAAEIEPLKRELAGRLYACGERVKANARFLLQAVPGRCVALRTVQQELQAALQKNMIVLATAHAVSEGIVRRLSGELARKAAPRVYGASGRTVAPNPRQARPLAISRTL